MVSRCWSGRAEPLRSTWKLLSLWRHARSIEKTTTTRRTIRGTLGPDVKQRLSGDSWLGEFPVSQCRELLSLGDGRDVTRFIL